MSWASLIPSSNGSGTMYEAPTVFQAVPVSTGSAAVPALSNGYSGALI